jgi:cation:H+ antiporter
MSAILLSIAGFLTCSALIIFSGSRLSKYGDIIATLSGMGKAWFGLILMAAVTSLPELFTGISSIVFVGVPNIAVGDIMGSCAFNLLILAVLDYFVPHKPLASVVTKSHVLAGFFGILLITFSVIAIVFNNRFPVIGWFSSSSAVIIILYLVAMRIIFKNEQRQAASLPRDADPANNHTIQNISLQVAIKRYFLFALVVIAGAIALPYFANHLAMETGLSKSFVGTLLVAASTSLPELVVSIAAVRMGSMDMAVGNLLGSNIFNMIILALDDLMYTKGPLFMDTNPNHALSGLVTLLMTAVVGISIIYSSPTKRFVLAIDAIILIFLYTILMIALYIMI